MPVKICVVVVMSLAFNSLATSTAHGIFFFDYILADVRKLNVDGTISWVWVLEIPEGRK